MGALLLFFDLSDDFPLLVKIASLCKATRDQLDSFGRQETAVRCWKMRFGDCTSALGHCAEWALLEQQRGAGAAAVYRWRWLAPLRRCKLTKGVKEKTVAHALPTKKDLTALAEELEDDDAFCDLFDAKGVLSEEQWAFGDPHLCAVQGESAINPLVVSTFDESSLGAETVHLAHRFWHDLRSGKLALCESHSSDEGRVVVCACGGFVADSCMDAAGRMCVREASGMRKVHVLLPPENFNNAAFGSWSGNGALLCVWSENEVSVFDIATAAVAEKYEVQALSHFDTRPDAVALQVTAAVVTRDVVHVLHAIRIDEPGRREGLLSTWDLSSGAMIHRYRFLFDEVAEVEGRPSASLVRGKLVSTCGLLFVTLGSHRIGVFTAKTLEPGGYMSASVQRGGHSPHDGNCVISLSAVGDVVLSLDHDGTLLAWDAPTQTLIRRLGRRVLIAPPCRVPIAQGAESNALAVTAAGAVVFESKGLSQCGASHSRIFCWALSRDSS